MKKQIRKSTSAPKPATAPAKQTAKAASTAVSKENRFRKAEVFLEKNERKWLLLLPVVLGILFSALTFDVKISEGNDDSMYIEAATKYAADFTGYFYTANAPLYPLMLGIVTLFTGFNLMLYKLINTFLFIAHLVIMYFAFRRRVPYLVLLPVLLLSAVNSFYLYYASQTYTEMLFVTLQGIFFWVFFYWQEHPVTGTVNHWQSVTTILSPVPSQQNFLPRIKWMLSIGFALLLMTLCKNVGIGALGAVILYFLLDRKWQKAGEVVAGFVIVRLLFEGLKVLVWGSANQYGAQSTMLLQKDPYNPAAGQEDIGGFIDRFFGNFNLYISKRTFQVLGFKDPLSNETHTILSLLVTGLVIFAAIRIVKDIRNLMQVKKGETSPDRDRPSYPYNLLFVLIYIVCMMSLTFLVLQIKWDQTRLVMIYVPLLIMVILYGFYSLFSKGTGSRIVEMAGYLLIVSVIVGSSFLTTVKKAVANYPVLKKNLAGDLYYGYTPDWENFLRLSAWCGDSLPPNSYVASRKAPMSFVYAHGKPFFPVYTVPAVDTATNLSNADSVLALFRENKVTHVILGSIRRNPQKPDGYIINTMHRMLQPVAQKYPEKIKLVKQMGTTEPAYLYEIKN